MRNIQKAEFTTLASAIRFSHRTVKASAIILGDHPRYWVCYLADAERLVRQGYEWYSPSNAEIEAAYR